MSLHNLCLFIVSSGANKGIFEAIQEVSLLLLAVKINFLLIRLTKQIALPPTSGAGFQFCLPTLEKADPLIRQRSRKLCEARSIQNESTRLVSDQ